MPSLSKLSLFLFLSALSLNGCLSKRTPVDEDRVKMTHSISGEYFKRKHWVKVILDRRKKEKSYKHKDISEASRKKTNQKNKGRLKWRPIWKKDPRIGEYRSDFWPDKTKKKLVFSERSKLNRKTKSDWFKEKLTLRDIYRRKRNKSRYTVSKKTKKINHDYNYLKNTK